MKKMIAGLFAGLILATGAQVLADGCEDGACELPQRQNTAYCYGGNAGYCYDGDSAQTSRDASANQRRGYCGSGRGYCGSGRAVDAE